MDRDVFGLTDSVDAIAALIFNSGIPPALEMNDVIGGGQRKAGACGSSGQNDGVEAGQTVLEGRNHFLTSFRGHPAVDFSRDMVKLVSSLNGLSDHGLDVEVLNKHDHLFLLGGDAVKNLKEGGQACRALNQFIGQNG